MANALVTFCLLGSFVRANCDPPGTWCTGGPSEIYQRNDWAITEPRYEVAAAVPNGALLNAHHALGNTSFPVVHLWGTPYQRGFAQGSLLRERLPKFWDAFWEYLVKDAGGNESAVLDMILPVVQSAGPYIGQHFQDEISGLAAATNYSRDKILWLHLFPETADGHCSMIGAWGEATRHSYGGKVLQLRALDYITADFLSDNHALIVYHDEAKGRNRSFVNIGFIGTISSVTGVSSDQISISEIGVSNPDLSFGIQANGHGIPFNFLLRDVLEYDSSVGAAQRRLLDAHRTVDLILGVGDGKAGPDNQDSLPFVGAQYAHSQVRFFNDQNETSIGWVNDTWHPVVKDVVYQGMDWLCPTWSFPLGQKVKQPAEAGRLDAEFVIREAITRIQTGNLHVAVYVPSEHVFFYSFSAGRSSHDAHKFAYQRPFLKVDTQKLFAQVEAFGLDRPGDIVI